MDDEYNVVTLDNGIEYTEAYRIINNGNTYVFLVNLDNIRDYYIKRVITKNDKEIVVELKDKSEFERILALFAKEYLS